MAVDLCAPTRAAMAAFGELAQKGFLWTYTSPDGTQTCDIDVIFDEAWASIEIKEKRFSIAPVSTTKPCVLVVLADFATGIQPVQDGTLVRGWNQATYSVADVQLDGFGCAHLPLSETD